MNDENGRASGRERGAVLIVAILLIVCMAVMAAPFLSRLSGQYRSTDRGYKSMAAFNLAEAGVDMAVFELNNMWLIFDWQASEDGAISRTIDDLAGSGGEAVGDVDIRIFPLVGEERIVDSMGKVPFIADREVDRSVQVVLQAEYGSIFKFAVFADEGIYMASNTRIDSYDTGAALAYDEKTAGANGHVGTNSSTVASAGGGIYLSSQDTIYGNVACGAGTPVGAVDDVIDTHAANTLIEGGKYVLGTPFDMTLNPSASSFVSGLVYDPSHPGLVAGSKGGTTVINSAKSGIYDSFVMDVNSKVRIEGDVTLYITGTGQDKGEFLMKNNTTIEIAQGSSLKLILGDTTFTQLSNTAVNNLTKTASNLVILGTEEFTGEMHWNSNTELYGAIAVPEASLHYDSNYDLYGSLVCDYLDFDANADIHYDEALGKLDWIKGGIPGYVVKSWQERSVS
jgi:hypothetical protein